MNILVDMNLSPIWVAYFKDEGIEAKHWSNIGNPAAPDNELFKWAKDNGFIVFTHDLDFGAILAATKAEGPSVIQIRTQDTMPRAIGPKVMNVINTYQASLEKGALIIMDEIKARIRILPLD